MFTPQTVFFCFRGFRTNHLQQTRLFLGLRSCSIYDMTHCSLYCALTARPIPCCKPFPLLCSHSPLLFCHAASLSQPHTHYAHMFYILSSRYAVAYYNKETNFVWGKAAGSETKDCWKKQDSVWNPTSERRQRDDSGCSDSLWPVNWLRCFNCTFWYGISVLGTWTEKKNRTVWSGSTGAIHNFWCWTC